MPPSRSDAGSSHVEPGDVSRQARPDDRNTYPAEKARQGTIILRHWWSRAIFIAGLIGGTALAFYLGALSY